MFKRFMRLTIWNKIGVVGAVASIVGLVVFFVYKNGQSVSVESNIGNVSVNQAGGDITNNTYESPPLSEEEKRAKRERSIRAEIARLNNRFHVGIARTVKSQFVSPNGVKKTLSRPEIRDTSSATEPRITHDKEEDVYIVEISQYVFDPLSENSRRLEISVLASEANYGPPAVDGPFD